LTADTVNSEIVVQALTILSIESLVDATSGFAGVAFMIVNGSSTASTFVQSAIVFTILGAELADSQVSHIALFALAVISDEFLMGSTGIGYLISLYKSP